MPLRSHPPTMRKAGSLSTDGSPLVQAMVIFLCILAIFAAPPTGDFATTDPTPPVIALALEYHGANGSVQIMLRAFVGTQTISDCFSLQLNGTRFPVWGNVSLSPGTYRLAVPAELQVTSNGSCPDVVFREWTTGGNLTVQNPQANETQLTVLGSGVLTAVYGPSGPHACTEGLQQGTSCVPNLALILGLTATGIIILAVLLYVLGQRRKGSPSRGKMFPSPPGKEGGPPE